MQLHMFVPHVPTKNIQSLHIASFFKVNSKEQTVLFLSKTLVPVDKKELSCMWKAWTRKKAQKFFCCLAFVI